MQKVKTREDVFSCFKDYVIGNGYYEDTGRGISTPYYAYTEKAQQNPFFTNKLVGAIKVSQYDFFQLQRKAERQQFVVPKDEKLPKGVEVKYNDGKNVWSKDDDWKPNTYYVARGHSILKVNFDTKDEAVKWAQENIKTQSKDGKQRFVPAQLKHIQRNGPDFRQGKEATGDDYLNTFGFRGGEFGNWVNQKERAASLDYGFDALKDLAAALKISDRDISYQGELAIAFDARGHGNAVAHYEPDRQVINLTKMKGAGSLAHEWWHGFDDIIGQKIGAKGFATEHAYQHPAFQKLMQTMKRRDATPEEAKAVYDANKAQHTKSAESWLTSLVERPLKYAKDESALVTYEALKSDFLAGVPGTLDKLNDLKKQVTGRVIPKEDRSTLETFERILVSYAEKTEIPVVKVDTDYYKASKEMSAQYTKEGKGYWHSDVEMSARAFAVYVHDKLPYQSDYLCGHALCAVGWGENKDGTPKVIKAYPDGEERKAINACFDELIDTLKRENLLTHDEQAPPVKAEVKKPEHPRAEPSSIPADAVFEQTSLFDRPAEKPSLLGQLAEKKSAAKELPAPVGKKEAKSDPSL